MSEWFDETKKNIQENCIPVDKSQWYKQKNSFVDVWTPIDGKHDLPKEGQSVYVTLKYSNKRKIVTLASIEGRNHNGEPIWISDFGYHIKGSLVKAWMSLPDPYISEGDKEETDGTESI